MTTDIHDWPVEFHTRVPIEGVGVVHVTTKPYRCRYWAWHTDIVLVRYYDGLEAERVSIPGSGCSASSADEMHTYWCDVETLALCAQGERYPRLIDEEYMDRKFRQLFGRPYLD